MRHQSMRRSLHKQLPNVPSSSYDSFRELLREQLANDSSFKAKYLAAQFESKLIGELNPVSDETRRQRAIDKWLSTEERNRDTNYRLFMADEQDFLFLGRDDQPVFAPDVISWCRKTVADLIGLEPDYDKLKGSFSGGASTSVRRGIGTISRKYQEGRDITGHAIWHYLRLSQNVVGMPRDLEVVEGNVMFTVPKSSEIDRCACKEPELNMYCQKAVGNFFRRRLKTVGINLNDQTINQRLSCIGSVDGSLATVDLSSASDSVTTQLVIALFPIEWAHLMLDLRSPITMIDGQSHVNEMISSMGNGYTFELESLIFWVLTRACAFFTRTKGRISVYGDDIICPSGLKVSLESTLEFFGFVLNDTKSFWSGPFRESCGKHWFAGEDVSPFYVKSTPKTVGDWCLLLNSLRRWSNNSDWDILDPRYYDLWSLFAELVPKPLHGARDLSRRDALVVPDIRCLARIVIKQHAHAELEMKYEFGSYLYWLDTTKDRTTDEIVTKPSFHEGGKEGIGRPLKEFILGIPKYPQEYGE